MSDTVYTLKLCDSDGGYVETRLCSVMKHGAWQPCHYELGDRCARCGEPRLRQSTGGWHA